MVILNLCHSVYNTNQPRGKMKFYKIFPMHKIEYSASFR